MPLFAQDFTHLQVGVYVVRILLYHITQQFEGGFGIAADDGVQGIGIKGFEAARFFRTKVNRGGNTGGYQYNDSDQER